MRQGLIRIASGDLAAEVDPLGAELHSLKDGEGRDLLWDGDPAFWTGRAPILFPTVGGLDGGRYRVDAGEYALPKHGFARNKPFTLTAQEATAAAFRLAADAQTRAAYPFDFQLDLAFRIEGRALIMTAEVANLGLSPMPAGFGFHPALRWPLPYGGARAEHRLRFDQPEPSPIRRVDASGLMLPDPAPSPVRGRDLVLHDDLFTNDAVIFDRLASTGLLYGPPEGRQLRVAWDGLPQLGVWTRPGAGYVCIEPWAGHADAVGYRGDFKDKPGVFTVAPGGMRRFTMTIGLEA